jgi:hypothetical protein
VELSGGIEFFDVFEFTGVESLCFVHTGRRPSRTMGLIPVQLTKLFLGSVKFPQIPPSGNPPQYLPELRVLELQGVVFDGRVRDYLRCPKLVELSYRCSEGKFVDDTTERKQHHYRDLVQDLFDESFFRGVPNLEYLFLHGLTLDAVLADFLKSCPLLHTMIVEDCQMKEFILSFASYIGDEKPFPSLKVLRIDDSWPMKFNTLYQEFHEYCRIKRSQLWITGNERIEIVYPPVSPFSDD